MLEEDEEGEGPPEEGGGALTPPLLLAVVAAALSSVQVGFNVGVLNVPYRALSNTSLWQRGPSPPVAVPLLPLGAVPAALAAAPAAERLGRKGALLASNGLAVIGGALMGGAELGPTYALVVIGRLVTGLHSGLASGLVPLYVEEVAPPPLQGALSAAHEAGFALGLLTSQVLALPPLLGSVRSLPALLALGMLPAALQLLLLPMGPGGAHGACAGPAPRLGLPQLWGRGQLRQPMAIVVGAALGKELAGIGALYYYSTAIFERAGLPQPTWATVATGVINMAATLAAGALWRRAGRRALLMGGLLGMALSSVVMTMGMSMKAPWPLPPTLAMGGGLLLVSSFAMGPGLIPRLLPMELIPIPARAAAAGVTAAMAWAGNGAVAAAVPHMELSLGPFLFLPFGVLAAVSALGVFLFLPETRGAPLGPPKPSTELQLLGGS
ncbi:solute carrier family 2, facilitated glucose transporter member 4-like [Melopsittacus undulatus]|uniref:solute carrier family 2, facilitated glucose transporter member 4-like n=1 Tax=Melopsittacus undulatus TaxID=13146 RepID=UPI00146C8C34|nr:solute carrier family 2, facilitated glucose transporter member 4-like [Melopsittacus undulatus]